jgi:hypothetical protein
MCNKVSELFRSFDKYAMLQIFTMLKAVDWVSLVINITFLTVFLSMVFCVYYCSKIMHEGLIRHDIVSVFVNSSAKGLMNVTTVLLLPEPHF